MPWSFKISPRVTITTLHALTLASLLSCSAAKDYFPELSSRAPVPGYRTVCILLHSAHAHPASLPTPRVTRRAIGPRCWDAAEPSHTTDTTQVLHGEPSPTPGDLRGLPSAHARGMAALTCPRGATRAPPAHSGCAVAAGSAGRRRDRDSGSRGVSQAGASSSAARVSAPRWKGARRPCAQPQPGGAKRPGRATLPAPPRTRPLCTSCLQRAFRDRGVSGSSPENVLPTWTGCRQQREGGGCPPLPLLQERQTGPPTMPVS